MSRTRAAVTILTAGVLAAGCGSGGGSTAGRLRKQHRLRTSASSSAVSRQPQRARPEWVSHRPRVVRHSHAAVVTTTAAVDELAVVREKASAAYAAKEAAWSTCLSQLPACDTNALAVAYTEPQLSLSRSLAEEWNSAGYYARNRESMTHRIEDVTINATMDEAIVTLCITDGGILYVPSSDGQAEQVINDTWHSAREAWTIVKGTDGVWRASREHHPDRARNW